MEKSPLQPTPVGAIRFNTDSSKLETYDGNQWVCVTSDSPEAQTGGTRGLIGGGYDSPARISTIDYINVSSTGNAVNFGNMNVSRSSRAAMASRTRDRWSRVMMVTWR